MINSQDRKSRIRLSSTSQERHTLTNDIFKILTPVLNDLNAVSFSEVFWKIVLAPYVSIIVNNYAFLNRERIYTEVSKMPHSTMFSSKEPFLSIEKAKYIIKQVSNFQNILRLNRYLKNSENIASGFHYKDDIRSISTSYLGPLYPVIKDRKIRKGREEAQVKYKDYSKIFITNIIAHLPKIYVEHFNDIIKKIPLHSPKKKVFHVSMFDSFFIRFVIAYYKEKGAKLCYYQHGGFYGEYQYHNGYLYEASIADHYMTWGWKMNDSDVPSKAFRLEKFRINYDASAKKDHDILLVFPFLYEVNQEHFVEISKTFFKDIDKKKYKHICARPRLRSKFNTDKNLLFLSNEDVIIDKGNSPMSDLISKSKIIILMNYPSTTMLECLYVDQPALAILKNDDPSAIVKPYYEFFIEEGLLHKTIDSLVNHLNENDIGLWWRDLIAKPTYIEFKNKFLNKV